MTPSQGPSFPVPIRAQPDTLGPDQLSIALQCGATVSATEAQSELHAELRNGAVELYKAFWANS